jgi:peptidoglycan/xylan/chitin deacetylase (PgdA/CDA1 family)
VTRLPTARHVVALTFDCGAGAQGLSRITSTLRSAGVAATFFVTGDFARDHSSAVSALASDGFVIGNHTMSHPHPTQITAETLSAEISSDESLLRSLIGRSTRPWFRYPYGEWNDTTQRTIHGLGYGAIGWTIDTLGWQGRSGGTAADVLARVRARLQPGAIVLMHVGANPDDGTTYDADELPAVIAAIRSAGYGFVTVAM